MPNPHAAQLIAQALTHGLAHPGDDDHQPIALPLPMFRTGAIDPELAEQFAQEAGLPTPDLAKLTAEAIVHTLEANGQTVIGADELSALQAAAEATQAHRHRKIRFLCTCGNDLFAANVSDYGTDTPRLNGQQLIRAMHTMSPDCATTHQPQAVQ